MSMIGSVVESALETESPRVNGQTAQADDRTMRYVGQIGGALGVVDVQVRRFFTPYEDIFRIKGTIRTPVEFKRFEVDGHSGYGRLDDESVVLVDLDERNLAITVNPFRPPAPTYYFRRR